MRRSKISADISKEASDMLTSYCEKHERSKGFLLEKMIRKFCGGEEIKTEVAIVVTEKPKESVKRFVRPTLIEVTDYMFEKTGMHKQDEAEKFCDHFESNGWKVGGKTKMVSWKAAVRNFLKKGNSNAKTTGSSQKLSANERVKQRNDAKYRNQPDECGLGVGANDGHMGRTVGEGAGGATIENVGDGTFIDYE